MTSAVVAPCIARTYRTYSFRQIDAAGLEGNNMDQNLGRMKLFNARRKFKSAIQTVIVADRLRKFTDGMAMLSTS